MIQLLDKTFKPYISSTEIDAAICQMATKINADYKGKNPLFICVLNGSFIIAADLMKKIDTQAQIEFIKVKSYEGTTSKGNVEWVLDIQTDISNKDIVIIEDIVDTGNTLESISKVLSTKSPKSIAIATLLFKKEAYTKEFPIDYIGIEIDNKFIVGYGLDYEEYGRNLPEIYQLV